MARKRDKNKRSRMATAIPRGGFLPPAPPARAFIQAPKKTVFDYSKNVLRASSKKAMDKGFEALDRSLEKFKVAAAYQAGKTTVGVINATINKVTGSQGETTQMPFMQTDTVRLRNAGSVTERTKRHVTRLESGESSSRGLKRVAANQGKSKRVTIDSLIDYDTSSNQRQNLDVTHGFNQKRYQVFEPAHSTTADFAAMYDLNPAAVEEQRLRAYLGVLNSTVSYKIYNLNQFFNMNVKIHIVRGRPGSNRITAANNLLLSAINTAAATQETGKIPIDYQFSGREVVSGFSVGVDVDPSVTLSDAPRFNDGFEIVRTIKKTLKPSDVWDFKHKLHYGPGLDLFNIREKQNLDTNSATGYMYIIETWGNLCTARTNTVPSTTVIGTAPGQYTAEFKVEYENVFRDLSAGTLRDATPGGLDTSSLYLVRYFIKEEKRTSTTPLINYGYDKIVPAGGGTDTAYIPVMSDKLEQSAGAQDAGT